MNSTLFGKPHLNALKTNQFPSELYLGILFLEVFFRSLLQSSSLEFFCKTFFNSVLELSEAETYLFQSLKCNASSILYNQLISISLLHAKFPMLVLTCRGGGSIVVNNPTHFSNSFVQQSIYSSLFLTLARGRGRWGFQLTGAQQRHWKWSKIHSNKLNMQTNF